jgi:hypothetical protein
MTTHNFRKTDAMANKITVTSLRIQLESPLSTIITHPSKLYDKYFLLEFMKVCRGSV